MSKTIIIAEVGVNHNGSIEVAKQLVDAAAVAGVDYVKFQTFKAENLVTKSARRADYQVQNVGGQDDSQFNMLKKLELTPENHFELIDHCKQRGVKFFSTAFDLQSVAFLDSLEMELWKVPSGEITNFPYLRQIGKTKKPVILSSGMASMQEIEAAIEVLVRFGTPRKAITLLHCTTEYPAPKNEVNLKAMDSLRQFFGLRVGYSDHTQGLEIPVAAVAMGACVIEKHFTLDRSMEGPDHAASLEPEELKMMVDQIRNVESAMGDGVKEPSASERKNIVIARKSIVASCPIKKGEKYGEHNLTAKRPASGLSPMEWEDVIGRISIRDFEVDEQIEL